MSWKTRKKFSTNWIRPLPFYKNNKIDNNKSKIIYSAAYDNYHKNQGGIFEYDLTTDDHNKVMVFAEFCQKSNIDFYAANFVIICNKLRDTIIFVGGRDNI